MKLPNISRSNIKSGILAFATILFGFLLIYTLGRSATTEGACTLVQGTTSTYVGDTCITGVPAQAQATSNQSLSTAKTQSATPKKK